MRKTHFIVLCYGFTEKKQNNWLKISKLNLNRSWFFKCESAFSIINNTYILKMHTCSDKVKWKVGEHQQKNKIKIKIQKENRNQREMIENGIELKYIWYIRGAFVCQTKTVETKPFTVLCDDEWFSINRCSSLRTSLCKLFFFVIIKLLYRKQNCLLNHRLLFFTLVQYVRFGVARKRIYSVSAPSINQCWMMRAQTI